VNHPASDIRRQATRLLDSAGISHEPVSLRDVVSALNLELVGKTREPFTSEAALEPLGDGRAIVPNGADDSGRRRFTIAHEIGHHRLHAVGEENATFIDEHVGGGGAKPRQEKEADAFAAYFLAPDRSLKADAERIGDITVESVVDLMIRYGLSFQATVFRLHNNQLINLVNAAKRDALRRDAKGRVEALRQQKGGYTEDDQILFGAELPKSFRENALKLFAHGVINDERLAEMLRMPLDDALHLATERGVTAPEVPDVDEDDLADLFDDGATDA
jgi:Zn-dependent peptidase ImmA (M78 family)